MERERSAMDQDFFQDFLTSQVLLQNPPLPYGQS